MTPYEILLDVLDKLRSEAPTTYKSYHPAPTEVEKLNAARSKALLHLFLKVRFGLLTFLEREAYITEGTDDGGIDAYYIDSERKVIYFLQAKFRTKEENFEDKSIDPEELLMMDITRVLEGETEYEMGKEYNQKVLLMGFKSGMTMRNREVVVTDLAPNLTERWRSFQRFLANSHDQVIPFRARRRRLSVAFERYLNSARFVSDVSEFLEYESATDQRYQVTRSDYSAELVRTIENLESRLENLDALLSKKESQVSKLRKKHDLSRSEEFSARVKDWIDQEEERIRSIKDEIHQVDGWLDEERGKL